MVYSTNSGSTADVAQAVAEELNKYGHTAEVSLVANVNNLTGYDAVVIGAPMIFGWHGNARRFVKQFRAQLAEKKTAYFACAARLTRVENESIPQLSLILDPNLASTPEIPGRLTIKERFTTLGYYLKPMLQAAPQVKLVSVAFFKGSLQMYRLKWWQAAFVMIVVQAPAGDGRDWEFIRSWAKSLAENL